MFVAGDDIGRSVPEVTSTDTGSRDVTSIIVGVFVAFSVMVAIMVLTLFIVFRRYRYVIFVSTRACVLSTNSKPSPAMYNG